jgi:hypothetical protein
MQAYVFTGEEKIYVDLSIFILNILKKKSVQSNTWVEG